MADERLKEVKYLLSCFIQSPVDFWVNNSRQNKKSEGRISRLINNFGWGSESLLELVSCLAEERIKNKVKTIYLSSFGSSGSHLIQHVLVDSFDMIGLGEIYLPNSVEKFLQESDQKSREFFLECYHLLHSPPENLFKNKPVINTAHKARLKTFSTSTSSFKSIFLMRDPVDLVISRTFRKGEYREYLGKKALSDEEYLMENIQKTKKFYQGALKYKYDHYLFFEDINNDQDKLARDITRIVGEENKASLALGALEKALDDGATNKYKGPKIVVPEELLSLAMSELKELSSAVNEIRYRQRRRTSHESI